MPWPPEPPDQACRRTGACVDRPSLSQTIRLKQAQEDARRDGTEALSPHACRRPDDEILKTPEEEVTPKIRRPRVASLERGLPLLGFRGANHRQSSKSYDSSGPRPVGQDYEVSIRLEERGSPWTQAQR